MRSIAGGEIKHRRGEWLALEKAAQDRIGIRRQIRQQ